MCLVCSVIFRATKNRGGPPSKPAPFTYICRFCTIYSFLHAPLFPLLFRTFRSLIPLPPYSSPLFFYYLQETALSLTNYLRTHFSRSHTDTSGAGRSLHPDTIVLNTHTPYVARRGARRRGVCAGWGRFGPQPLLDICHDRRRRASSRLIPTHPLPHVDHGTLVRQRSAWFGRRAVRPRFFPLTPSRQCRLFRHAHLLRAVVTSRRHTLLRSRTHL